MIADLDGRIVLCFPEHTVRMAGPVPSSHEWSQQAVSRTASPLPARAWFALGLFAILGYAVVKLLPPLDLQLQPFSESPGFLATFGVGIVMTLLTAGVVYVGLRFNGSATSRFLFFVFLYNALIAIVKFALAPRAVYDAMRRGRYFESAFEEAAILTLSSMTTFLLYFIAFRIIHRRFEARVAKSLGVAATQRRIHRYRNGLVFTVALILASSGTFLWFSLYFDPPIQYLSFIFSSARFAIPMLLALLGAVFAAVKSFDAAASQDILLGKATMVAALFWFGLALLAIYHALWVVFMLALAGMWPLKVVTPK